MKLTNDQSGQTIIALLIFMLVAMTITIASIAIAITNIQGNNSISSGQIALQNAESGAENAILLLQRNPSYSGGTMTLNNGTATISVSGSGTITIVSIGSTGNFQRKVTVTASQSANVINVTHWSETP